MLHPSRGIKTAYLSHYVSDLECAVKILENKVNELTNQALTLAVAAPAAECGDGGQGGNRVITPESPDPSHVRAQEERLQPTASPP